MGNCCAHVRHDEDTSLRGVDNTKPDQEVVEYSSMADNTQKNSGVTVKRIKVVITKKELQRLLRKQISVEKVIEGIEKRNGGFVVVSPRNWKPKLEAILEGNE